jgi:GxxExxY protein
MAIEVHRHLGPGLLEAAYEDCLCHELTLAGIPHARQVLLPVRYKGLDVGAAYRLDVLVGQTLIVEIKSVERLMTVHDAQLLTYLRLSGLRTGLLLNFNHAVLKDGIRRLTI